MTKRHSGAETGFTMLEIVTVLVLIGILAAVVVPRFYDVQSDSERKAALAAVAEAQVRINTGYSRRIYEGRSCPDAVATVNRLSLIGDDGTNVVNGFALSIDGDAISDTGTAVTVKRQGSEGSPTFSGTEFVLKVPSCPNSTAGGSESGFVCPDASGTTPTWRVTCNNKTADGTCGDCTYVANSDGTLNLSCTSSQSSSNNGSLLPGGTGDASTTTSWRQAVNTIQPRHWMDGAYDNSKLGFSVGELIECEGRYYVALKSFAATMADCGRDIREFSGYVTAANAGGKADEKRLVTPLNTDDDNWVTLTDTEPKAWESGAVQFGNVYFSRELGNRVFLYRSIDTTDVTDIIIAGNAAPWVQVKNY